MKRLPGLWPLLTVLFAFTCLVSDRAGEETLLSSERRAHIAHIRSFYKQEGRDNGFPVKLTYPYEAALQEYIMTMDPASRKIPAHRRLAAARQAIARKYDRKLKSGGDLIQWNELAANTGGRTRALMFDPTDPEHKKVWAGAVTGGLWYTADITDLSEPWVAVDDFWENLAIGCMCYDPNDPQTFYVGTGEGQTAFVTYRESSGTGRGIMRSRDAGTTWELMPSTSGFAYITDIQVRDENGNSVIYVGTKSGEYHGRFFNSRPDNGLYRSDDGGVSWQQVLPDIPGKDYTYPVSDIEVASSGRIFVGTVNNLELEGGGRVLYSDDGLNWTVYDQHIPGILADQYFFTPGRVIIASAPSDPQRIYAVIGTGALGANGVLYIYCREIHRSDDGGQTWTVGGVPHFRDNPGSRANWAYIAWHALTAAVDPEDPDILYIGGCDLHRSDDGGVSWNWISDTWGVSLHSPNDSRYVHADQHTIIFQPGSRDLLVNANDGGVFISFNARDPVPDWAERNESFNTMQFYTCAMHPGEGVTHFLGGTQDNSTMLYEGVPVTDDGSRYLGGDGAYCFVDQDEAHIHILSTQWNNYALSYDLKDTLIDFSSMFKSGLFINPADYDSRSNTLIGNAALQEGVFLDEIIIIEGIPDHPSGVFKQVNAGAMVPFSAVRVSPHSPSQLPSLYLGTQSGRLFKVMDLYYRSPQAKEITGPDFPAANISCIQLGNSEAEILLTFSNYGVVSVWVSRDGGRNWLNREGNLPDIPVRWALWHPANRNHVLLATEVGIWSCDNIWAEEAVWEPELEGLANVRVDMMQMRESDYTVLAASHGRGMYTGTWEVEADSLVPPPTEEGSVSLYPNPSPGKVSIRYKPRWNEMVRVRVFDPTGREVYQAEMESYAGEYEKTLDLSGLGPGTFILHITMGGSTSAHSLVLTGPDSQ